MAAEHTPTEPRHLAQLASESWPWREGQDGPNRTWKKAALSRLRGVGVCVREEDEPLVKQMLQDVKSGKTTSFSEKRRERLAHDKLLPAAIMACVSMCDGVSLTIAKRLFNPVAREELKDMQALTEVNAATGEAVTGSAAAGVPAGRGRAKLLREWRQECVRWTIAIDIRQLTTYDEVLAELTKEEMTPAAISIGRQVGRLLWQHAISSASLDALRQHFARCNGEAGQQLRRALKSAEELTLWAHSLRPRAKVTIGRKEAAPTIAALFMSERDGCVHPQAMRWREVRVRLSAAVCFPLICWLTKRTLVQLREQMAKAMQVDLDEEVQVAEQHQARPLTPPTLKRKRSKNPRKSCAGDVEVRHRDGRALPALSDDEEDEEEGVAVEGLRPTVDEAPPSPYEMRNRRVALEAVSNTLAPLLNSAARSEPGAHIVVL